MGLKKFIIQRLPVLNTWIFEDFMKYVIGNLIEMADQGNFDVIVHGCNCFNTMGAGIAAAIRNRWPAAYEADLQTKKGSRQKLGTYTFSTVCDDKAVKCYDIINAYTQFTYWDVDDMLSYDAIGSVFNDLKDEYGLNAKIGIPLIGAGLARGDWNYIEEIIDEIGFTNLTCVVFNLDEAKRVGIEHKLS